MSSSRLCERRIDPNLASYLRIEERELEAGELAGDYCLHAWSELRPHRCQEGTPRGAGLETLVAP